MSGSDNNNRYRYNGNITDERLEVFLDMLHGDMPEYLYELEKYAGEKHVPVMRHQSAWCIKFFIEAMNVSRILEVGTAIGYSALFMAWCGSDIKIDTIEKVKERIETAGENFKKYDTGSQITLLEGDAADVLDELVDNNQSYDMVFLDAAKAQYPAYLTAVEKLLRKGGVLITDNVLQEGCILESRYAVTRRDRTIHKRMREYLDTLTHSPETWNTMIIPAGDGIAVSTKVN